MCFFHLPESCFVHSLTTTEERVLVFFHVTRLKKISGSHDMCDWAYVTYLLCWKKKKIFLEVVLNGVWWGERSVWARDQLSSRQENPGQGLNTSRLCLLLRKNCHVLVNDLMSHHAYKLHASLIGWMEQPSTIMENIGEGCKIRSFTCHLPFDDTFGAY